MIDFNKRSLNDNNFYLCRFVTGSNWWRLSNVNVFSIFFPFFKVFIYCISLLRHSVTNLWWGFTLTFENNYGSNVNLNDTLLQWMQCTSGGQMGLVSRSVAFIMGLRCVMCRQALHYEGSLPTGVGHGTKGGHWMSNYWYLVLMFNDYHFIFSLHVVELCTWKIKLSEQNVTLVMLFTLGPGDRAMKNVLRRGKAYLRFLNLRCQEIIDFDKDHTNSTTFAGNYGTCWAIMGRYCATSTLLLLLYQ